MDSWARNFVMLRTDVQGRPINRLEGVYVEHFPDVRLLPRDHAARHRPTRPATRSPSGVSKTAIMGQGGQRNRHNGDAHVPRLGPTPATRRWTYAASS